MKNLILACACSLTYALSAAPCLLAQDSEPAAAGLPVRIPPDTLSVWAAGSGDVDADGHVDLLVLRQDGGGSGGGPSVSALGVLRADGNGGYAPLEELGVVPQEQRIWDVGTPLRFEDLTGDGEPDVFAPNAGVFPGLGGGQFGPLIPLAAEDSLFAVSQILVGHIDGDNRVDLLLRGFVLETTSFEWVVFLGQADGSFAAQALGSSGLPASPPDTLIALRDLDADGDDDLLTLGCADQGGVSTQVLQSWLNNGSGQFAAPLTAASFDDCLAQVGIAPGPLHDFDGDGVLDLAVRRTDHAVVDPVTHALVYRGDGAGAFSLAGEIETSAELRGGGTALAGDFNGDGAADLALLVQPYALMLYRGAGDLSFEPATGASLQSALSFPPAQVAQLNADALDDIFAVTELLTGTVHNYALVPALGSATPFVDLGFASGDAQLVLTGTTTANAAVELQLLGVAPGTPALLALALEANPLTFSAGTLIPDASPRFLIVAGDTLRTRWPAALPNTVNIATTVYVQALTSSASGLQLSNAVAAVQQ
ncbi:MAG: hypothetical protein DHS20C15_26080 [Planctomycetota bacterium]|nr:MAG: hypothetical protein DHS20C15_26080 [Planctomycetota bacterium]